MRLEFAEQPAAAVRTGVVEAGRDPVPGECVPQLFGAGRPAFADQLDRFETALVLVAPLAQELGDRLVEVLVGTLHGTRYPMVDLAPGDGVEDRPGRVPLAPADRGHPRHRRVDLPDLRQRLDAIRVGLSRPADDQRDRRASFQQLTDRGFKLGGLVADDDLVVLAVAPGQLTAQGLPFAAVTAGDHDRGPPVAGSAGGPATDGWRGPLRLVPRNRFLFSCHVLKSMWGQAAANRSGARISHTRHGRGIRENYGESWIRYVRYIPKVAIVAAPATAALAGTTDGPDVAATSAAVGLLETSGLPA